MRARELGITIGTLPTGEHNAITDVAGVRVGHTTLVEGDDIRTGVTVVVPADHVAADPVYAAHHRLNGNGEMTGLPWLEEAGLLHSPIGLTNTHSVGVVRDALVALELAEISPGVETWALPVVAETWDGELNDVDGFHVTGEHARAAYTSARGGRVEEGAVGGGTGMTCHEFKAGIGTSSRTVGRWTVGVLVQANYGRRERFSVNGVPVGLEIGTDVIPGVGPAPRAAPGAGSIIGIVATDAPLLPLQCRRLAQRSSLGIARMGGVGENSSGDLFLAFSTANRGMGLLVAHAPDVASVQTMSNSAMTPLFDAVIEATEEAILNSILAADTMTGRGGTTAYALEHGLLLAALAKYGRPASPR
ncbi:P1 family peptidase [Nocardioides sp.]|uniref:DmpA family aminopeptidase n=1 Tax=Nocardioides sp. TaxID=35761 RepID=UPI003D0CF532